MREMTTSGTQSSLKQRLVQASEAIKAQLGIERLPETLVVLGSGFKGFEATLSGSKSLNLSTISGMPVPRVEGHGAALVVGRLGDSNGGREVAVLTGRVHLYEGHDAGQVVFPLRVMANLGVRRVLLTNAAGSLDPKIKPGQVVVLSDHINFTGQNCLTGEARELGSTFLDMGSCYDPTWREQLLKLITQPALTSGVYAGVLGPSYETPAETRMFGALGAHVVGMSTVQEAIAAHHLGVSVACLSFVTNMAGGLGASLHHSEVLDLVTRHQEGLKRLLTQALSI